MLVVLHTLLIASEILHRAYNDWNNSSETELQLFWNKSLTIFIDPTKNIDLEVRFF